VGKRNLRGGTAERVFYKKSSLITEFPSIRGLEEEEGRNVHR